MAAHPDIEPLGDAALLVRIGTAIDEPTHRRVRAAYTALRAATLAAVGDIVPAYATLTLHYDPVRTEYHTLANRVQEVLADVAAGTSPASRLLTVPVAYGGVNGPDLDEVAAYTGLTAAEVVRRHIAGEYVVHMIGFAPGFPYLSGMDPRLAIPRREAPRTRVPAGSVGIGGTQTGIYSIETPGGWQLIGRTALVLFDAGADPPCLLAAGDRVRFVAVS